MKTYDLYGTRDLSPAELRDRVRQLLNVEFQARESSYRDGVYYRAGDLHDEHLVILSNLADDPDDVPEPEFADTPVLLEVNAGLRPDALRERLAAISELVLLRTNEV